LTNPEALPIIFSLLATLQSYYYLLLVNVDIPFNLKEFMQGMNILNLNFNANLFKMYATDNNLDDSSFAKLQENGYSSCYLINDGNAILSLLGMILATYLLQHVDIFLRKRHSYRILMQFLLHAKKPVLRVVAMNFLILNIPNFFLASLIQIVSLNYSNWFFIVNLWIGYFSFLGVLIMLRLVLIKASEKKQEYEALYEEYRFTTNPSYQLYPFMEYFKRVLILFPLVLLQYAWVAQSILVFVINLSYSLHFIHQKPMQSKLNFVQKDISELGGVILSGIFVCFALDRELMFLNIGQKISLGWFGCVIIGFVICVQLIIIICMQLKCIYTAIKAKWLHQTR